MTSDSASEQGTSHSGYNALCRELLVVICSHNGAPRLSATLSSLAATQKPTVPWRVLLVDNASSDETSDLAESFEDRLPLEVLLEPRTGKSHALNAAVAKARDGDLVLFLDDDISVPTNWIVDFWAEHILRPENYLGCAVDSVFLGARPPQPLIDKSPFSIRGFEPLQESGGYARTFPGASWACPAQYLRSIGGFDESMGLGTHFSNVELVGEEADIQRRLRLAGIQGHYCHRIRVGHRIEPEKSSPSSIGRRVMASSFTTDVRRFDHWTTFNLVKRSGRLSLKVLGAYAAEQTSRVRGGDRWAPFISRWKAAGSLRASATTLWRRLVARS